MKITYLEDSKKFEELTKKRVLVDFYADWCGPCKMMSGVLEKVESNMECLKVNVDKFNDLALKYGIMSIPTVIIFQDGKEIKKNIGFMDLEELNNFINK